MNRRTLSAHLLKTLALAQFEGRASTLESLVADLGVRRGDVRSALSALHREGYVDVLRMRLTLKGFAIGSALANDQLAPLRHPQAIAIAAA